MTGSTLQIALLATAFTWAAEIATAQDGALQQDAAQQPPAQQAASQQPTSAPQPALPHVLVTAERTPDEGDYRVKTVDSLGPLGTTPLQDIPYSVGVLPEQIIKNSQATNFKDVSKYLPLVSYQEQQGPDILRPQTRGMQGGNFQNTRLDGMQMFITVANAMEQFQQIEVVNGPSSFLYGPANPSGMFNFVSKRPTGADLREVSVTYDSNSVGSAVMDLSGALDQGGVVRYRFNGVFGEGEGFVDRSHVRRVLGDLGVDIRPFENTVLELNYSDYHLLDHGFPGWFTYGEKIDLPPAPDPTRVGYGQSYAGVDLETRIGTARIKHDFSPDWHLVAGVLNQDASRDINTPVNNVTSNSGNYTSSVANGFAPRFVMSSDVGYLNGNFATGSLTHDLTIGTAGYKSVSYSVRTPATPASVLLGKASFTDPLIFAPPAGGLPNVGLNFDSSNAYQQGVNVGDLVHFNEQWAARLGVSQDWFHTTNFKASGAELPEYSSSGASPTASLIFKPLPEVTTYATYASSLQAGDLAPTGTVNAGTSLAPYRSDEIEAGLKATVSSIDFTAAVYRIKRPFANINLTDNVFEISGDQVNKGLELSAIGTVATGLTMYGGLTLLDPKLENTGVASTNDKLFVGQPKIKGNVLLEYAIPAIQGLVTSFDYQFAGTRAGDDTNKFFVAGYNLFDLGVRYSSPMVGKNVTWRLAVNNITDRHYWSTVAPSNLTGTNTGSLIGHLGLPRMVLASVSVDF
ncbi:MAG TPA: TonB-dependent siderophore receptor [Steroidobacteraceae bacterium]|nr:TonB-dependent siderophore receptor [Steroidobacteraceae bacterium]